MTGSSHFSGSTMFLPTDMTTSEDELAATVTRQLLEHRAPTTPAEEQATRSEADQVAAEMIQAQRAETSAEAGDEGIPETGYHALLQKLVSDRQAQLDEDAAERL